jgi:branched-chain amino acid transport system ATP-binding protein
VNLKVRRGSIHALIGPNGAGKTTCFNLITKFLPPTRGQILYNGQDITRGEGGRHRAARHGAQLPDLGDLPASDAARERARRAAAQLGTSFHFWRSESSLNVAQRPRAWNCSRMSASPPTRTDRRRAALRPQARARDRDDAGARPGNAAARRADLRHGPRGHRPRRRADPARRANRTVLMVEHNLSVVPICPTRSPCSRAARSSPRGPTAKCRRIPKSWRPIWAPAWRRTWLREHRF